MTGQGNLNFKQGECPCLAVLRASYHTPNPDQYHVLRTMEASYVQPTQSLPCGWWELLSFPVVNCSWDHEAFSESYPFYREFLNLRVVLGIP